MVEAVPTDRRAAKNVEDNESIVENVMAYILLGVEWSVGRIVGAWAARAERVWGVRTVSLVVGETNPNETNPYLLLLIR